ncbi:MAG: hypothetical protein IGS23_12625 [Rivularia sp. T60_A2020_040]|nr:hypothetical protein [Rivularia sp. T60_A2020_040]
MTFPQLQEFLETAQPMRMYLDVGDKLSPKSSNTLVLPVVFSHMSFLLIQALCETGHGEFRITSEKKNHEIAVYLGSHITYRYLLNSQQVVPIKNAYHQVTNTWNKWHFSE